MILNLQKRDIDGMAKSNITHLYNAMQDLKTSTADDCLKLLTDYRNKLEDAIEAEYGLYIKLEYDYSEYALKSFDIALKRAKGIKKSINRVKNAKKIAKQKETKTRSLVFDCLEKMTFLNEKITSVTVNKAIGVSRVTASKYIKQFRAG